MTDERTTSDEPTAIHDPLEQHTPQPQQLIDAQLAEHDPWLDEAEELPPRPRRRVLKPLPLALLGALAIACGFIAGVLVEKGQSGSASGAGAGGGFASRLAALSGASGAGSGSSSSSGTGSAAPSAGTAAGVPGGESSGGRVGGGSTTVGQVAYVSKGTLYVMTSEGNTVKVTAASGASVTKTAKAKIKAIHPGETVLVAGTSGANGAISASSIRIGSVAGGLTGGGVSAGASAAGGAPSSPSSGAAASGAGEPQLFGKG